MHGALNLDLFDDSPPVVSRAPGGYRAPALAELCRHPDCYPANFRAWIVENWKIWTAFCRLAEEARNAGRDHYSARGIFHVLRFHTLLHEHRLGNTGPEFKINNRWSAPMARLYNRMLPENAGFFELRNPERDD